MTALWFLATLLQINFCSGWPCQCKGASLNRHKIFEVSKSAKPINHEHRLKSAFASLLPLYLWASVILSAECVQPRWCATQEDVLVDFEKPKSWDRVMQEWSRLINDRHPEEFITAKNRRLPISIATIGGTFSVGFCFRQHKWQSTR